MPLARYCELPTTQPENKPFSLISGVFTAGTDLAHRSGMSFRVETTSHGIRIVIVCEGHLDAAAIAAIEHALAVAEAAGQRALIKVCRGATADRPVVARLAGYPVERLEVESPFLRSWLEEVRTGDARTAGSGGQEHAAPGSEGR